ncbi:helix-turn-helix domain-containing protein [Streptomyces mirabilis]|uniref:helix-turn-helix domain-containing protein n=1 Tax=Streptomyces mirabilis TaxID=68239 RepID=UPI0036DC69F4
MAKDEKERPLAAIVGERLKAFREEKGLRQADVAAAASKWGLSWARSSIAALEAGTRNLSMEELLLLPFVISELGGWSSPLIPPDAWIELSSTRKIQAKDVGSLADRLTAPQSDLNAEHPLTGTTLGVRRPDQVEADVDDDLYPRQMFAEDMAWRLFCARMYPGVGHRGWGHSANLGNDLELVARVAKKIENPSGGTASYGLVNILSWVLWKSPIEAERDRRTGLRGVLRGRGLQSAKGHVTRELISEIEAEAQKAWPVVNEIFGELVPIWSDGRKLDEWAHRARSEATRLETAADRQARLLEFKEKHPHENAALDEIVGEIKAARVATGLTYGQLADMILMPERTYEAIEERGYLKDRNEPRVRQYIKALARAVALDQEPLIRRFEEARRADRGEKG